MKAFLGIVGVILVLGGAANVVIGDIPGAVVIGGFGTALLTFAFEQK